MSQVELTTLGKACEFFNGKAHEKDIDENGNYIVVNSKFISQEGRVVKRTKKQMFPLYKGDIVMVMSDVPNGKALAKCFIIDQDDNYSLNQRICCIRSKEFDTKYLYYQLNRNDHFLAFNNGENQTNLRKDDILDCPLIKPSMDEQRRMVEEFDSAFKSLDRVKLNLIQNINNSVDLLESYLQTTFEKNQWQEMKIQEVTKVINGYAFSSRDFKPTNTIKSIKITNVGVKEFVEEKDNYLPENYSSTLKEYLVSEGNIVIALTRTIISAGLKVAVVPKSYHGSLINQRVAALVPKDKVISQRFLYNYLTTKKVEKYVLANVNTLMQPNLSITDLRNMPIPIPPLSEQEIIVKQLDKLRLEAKNLEYRYNLKLDAIEELKSGILKRAFENELIEAE